jgi:hypothetical protein
MNSDAKGPPLQGAAHWPSSPPHGKPPPANEVPADRRPKSTPSRPRHASPPRARRRRRRTVTHPTTIRSRSSVGPQIQPRKCRIRSAHHPATRTAAHAGEPLQRPETAAPTPLHRREEERPRRRLPCGRAESRRPAREAARRDSVGRCGGARVEVGGACRPHGGDKDARSGSVRQNE